MIERRKAEDRIQTVARNRRARFDYVVEHVYEAGLSLLGTEVKSLRLGAVDLSDGYAALRGTEIFLVNVSITPYPFGTRFNHEAKRERKCLLHRREIDRLLGRVRERGYTLIPLSIYFKNSHAKVELGLARGRKGPDKRIAIRERDYQREMRTQRHLPAKEM